MCIKEPQLHLLRIVLSSRKMTAQVTNPITNYIVSMASTSEPEFVPQLTAKLNRNPRPYNVLDSKLASRIGEKLGVRLKEIGILDVGIDLKEELSRPLHLQKLVSPVFVSVKQAGINVIGSNKLLFKGDG